MSVLWQVKNTFPSKTNKSGLVLYKKLVTVVPELRISRKENLRNRFCEERGMDSRIVRIT